MRACYRRLEAAACQAPAGQAARQAALAADHAMATDKPRSIVTYSTGRSDLRSRKPKAAVITGPAIVTAKHSSAGCRCGGVG
jgi:hypothetical protein